MQQLTSPAPLGLASVGHKTIRAKAREDGLVTVDMGPPELNGPKVPSTLPTNDDGVVLKEPIKVGGLLSGQRGREIDATKQEAQPLTTARMFLDTRR